MRFFDWAPVAARIALAGSGARGGSVWCLCLSALGFRYWVLLDDELRDWVWSGMVIWVGTEV